MVRNLYIPFVIALLLTPLCALGQSIKTDFDKKVIYTDSLNLPRNTSADALIALLPELVQRPGDQLMTNYDIKIEGMSVGAAADVALSNLQIVDIEKVEVSESPVSSYQNNGQGGSINFVLRSEGVVNKNQWGSAGVMLANPTEVLPQFIVGYKTDKFMLRGVVLGDVYNTTNETQTIRYDGGEPVSQSHSSVERRFRTEVARLYMQYKLTSRDVLKFNLSQDYTYNKTFEEKDFSPSNTVSQRKSSLNLSANLKYQHSTPRSSFTAEAKYTYSPQQSYNTIPGFYSHDTDQYSNSLSGKLEYKNIFLKTTSAKGARRRADITVGSNFNGNVSNEDATIADHTAAGPAYRHTPKNNTYYVSPYMTLSGAFGKFGVKATGEFQHFRYNIERGNEPHSAISNDFTGKLMAEWHFTEAQNLRLILDRKLKRPSADQLYPNRIFLPSQMSYVEGNPDLLPTMVHEAMLDYIYHHAWTTFSNIIFNVSASISNVDDIIIKKTVKQNAASSSGNLGLQQDYVTYENSGHNNIASANLMTLYTYKAFSLSFAGNVYHKMLGRESNNRQYTYYNFSLYPHFMLKDGWNGGARFVYFSRISQSNGYTGNSAVSCMTVGKAWRQFFVYLIEDVALNKRDTDVTTSGTQRTQRSYNLIQNFVGVGMKFSF